MINFNLVKSGDYLICIKGLNNIFTFIKNKEYKITYITKNSDPKPFGILISDNINKLSCEFYESSVEWEFFNTEVKNKCYYDDYFIDKNSWRKEKLKKLL